VPGFVAALPEGIDGFMHLPGVKGGSRDAHHLDWFGVTALGFSVSVTPSSVGIVGSKATWTFGATLVGDDGLPALLEDAASQQSQPTITFNFDRTTSGIGGNTQVQLLAITLENARLASTGTTISTGTTTTAGGVAVDLSFDFTIIAFDVAVLDATGRISHTVSNRFDLATRTGGPTDLAAVTYGIGSNLAPVTEEISGFTPQTEKGVALGRTTFGPASVVIPRFDPSALNSVALAFHDEILPEAHVDFFPRTTLTEPTLKYDFGKVLTSSVSVSGLTATVSFSANDLHWTTIPVNANGTLGTPVTKGWSVSRNMPE
jgi:type VI protein secretion system component Hcp